MADSIPFISKAAVLDQFIHSSEYARDPDIAKVIIDAISNDKELRRYFFNNRPSSAWVPVLWEAGFYDRQPEPEISEQGTFISLWDAHEFLLSVAPEVPDLFIRHFNNLDNCFDWYKAHAVESLMRIDPEIVKTLIPKVVHWLSKGIVDWSLSHDACQLLLFLTKQGLKDEALSLFSVLTIPVLKSVDNKQEGFFEDQIKLLGHSPIERRGQSDIFMTILEELDGLQLVRILDENLRVALSKEAELSGRDVYKSSYWRSAIEDTDQDSSDNAKDLLIRALRDAVYQLIKRMPTEAQKIVEDYQKSEYQIYRRLGLHFLSQYPSIFPSLVARELSNYQSLDETGIHHEFFLLLNSGFPFLPKEQQETLVNKILQGPPPENTEWLVESVAKEHGVDKDEYRNNYINQWISNRLWMIKDYLNGEPKAKIDKYVMEHGEPDQPTFLSWVSSFTRIHDISPFSEDQLISLSPEELLQYIRTWKPNPRERFHSERVSWSGFAGSVANIVTSNPSKYSSHLAHISMFRPEFAGSIFSRVSDEKYPIGEIDWWIWVSLAEKVVSEADKTEPPINDPGYRWREVRREIVKIIGKALNGENSTLPEALQPKLRDILLILVDDPDPNIEQDRPTEGWFGHMDPFTVAINHIRPMALEALIDYALIRAKKENREDEDRPCWEAEVRNALTQKLDKSADPSWSVHSIFGKLLPFLYWLDKDWVAENISDIFPDEKDEEAIWFFTAAWDAFVVNTFRPHLMQLLKPRYNQAIMYLSRGYQTKSNLNPTLRLAVHVTLEYFLGDYNINSEEGNTSLIVKFYKETNPTIRANIAKASGFILRDNPDQIDDFWSKARNLWEWRAREAAVHGNSSDYDNEMQEFAYLPKYAPKNETIKNLWPLLEGLLPHIGYKDRSRVDWRMLEMYLVEEVRRDPYRTIQFYKMMFDQLEKSPRWLYHSDEAKQIISIAISSSNPEAKQTTLELLDIFYRWGDNTFRDLYLENLG